MLVRQISVFLENKSGRLAEVTRNLCEENIDIRALYIADTTEYGILRMLVDRPEDALKVLTDNGFTVHATDVIAIAVEDKPGCLEEPLRILSEAGISLEYLYAYVGRTTPNAVIVLRVENNEQALSKFTEAGICILSPQEVYDI
ncbi:MAG: acetolactate synthase [Saccharofermentanales bacterium]|jgi:hypothetical protein